MNTTFYGVLGVGPDADDDAISAAYRERVKDHHPDVSAEPDAAEHFKRLTAAKEVLLDPEERRRYDRLGHASYVDAHGDASLWTVDQPPGEADSPAATEPATARPGAEARSRSESESECDDEDEEDSDQTGSQETSRGSRTRTGGGTRNRSRATANRSRSATASESRRGSSTAGGSGSAGSGRTTDGAAAGSASDTGNGSARATANGSPAGAGPTATSSGSDPTADNTSGSRSGADSPGAGSWSTGSTATGRSSTGSTESRAVPGGSRSASRSGRSRRTATATNERPGRTASTATAGSYGRSSFWDASDGEVPDGKRVDPLSSRAVGVLRTLGAWLLVHLLFLSLAVGTGWYVYAVLLPPARRTLPLLFVLFGEVGLALVLSSLHVLSRVYR